MPTPRAGNSSNGGEASAGALAAPFPLSQPAVSRHLKVMARAGLIAHRRAGTRRMVRLAPHRIAELDLWLDRFRVALDAGFGRADAVPAEKDGD